MTKRINILKNAKYECVIVDDYFHEKKVKFNMLPSLGHILELGFDKKNTIRSKFKVTSVTSKTDHGHTIYSIKVTYLGRS